MKRLGVAMIALLLVIVGYTVASQPWMEAEAQIARVIPLIVVNPNPVGVLEPGAGCSFTQTSGDVTNTNRQIVVENESGTIIAIQDVGGIVESKGTGMICTAFLEVPVPQSAFYVVFLDETRIAGFSDKNLPSDVHDGPLVIAD